MGNKKRKIIKPVITIIVFLLPVIFGCYLFLFKDISVDVKSGKMDDGKVLVTIQKSNVTISAFQNVVARIFQVPLNLTNYSVCFRNKSQASASGIFGETKDFFLDASAVNLESDEQQNSNLEPLTIPANGHKCVSLNLDKVIIGHVEYRHKLEFTPASIQWSSNIYAEEKASLDIVDKLVTTFVVIFAMYGTLLLLKSIYEVMKENIKLLLNK